MSYYPSQTGQHPQTPGAYPYGAYHYPATPGAYPYQTGSAYPTTAVTGYGTTAWPYAYNHHYYQQHAAAQAHAAAQRSAAAASASTATAPASSQNQQQTQQAVVPTVAPPTRTTFSAYTPTTYQRESVTAAAYGGATGRGSKKQGSTFKGLFNKELRNLMFGFGDDRNPANDTVNVMEEILVEYIADVCQSALAPTRKTRLSIEDLRRALSRPADAKKLARMEELLFMQEDIKRARAQFDDSDIQQSSALQQGR
ncbi:TFIID-domain-containing protein [Stereum hirsutum FP-91666 SS1]|uniref:TFIID-domain-containing protein n=1 Tax=Stereum hirsutum (strain FP-91666) TaxID=721885 RepID=UPI000440A79B|nr:TFIID-domain-containing protein [Stereum hirsutum FP-91666 SS1]EIM90045.1 TFIID-domain-containing protein [Stereum hirsutum FP-91666 SS1]